MPLIFIALLVMMIGLSLPINPVGSDFSHRLIIDNEKKPHLSSVVNKTNISNPLYNATNDEITNTNQTTSRVYQLRKCGGAGCPYSASWLIHINLYKRIELWMSSTKMEEASFQVFNKAKWKFQLSNPDDYYVHHLSVYEHSIHRHVNLTIAKIMSERLSLAAYRDECFVDNDDTVYSSHIKANINITDNKKVRNEVDGDTSKQPLLSSPSSSPSSSSTMYNKYEYLALIPFYGGLPPNVTADGKVDSVGQGNSLMSTSTKALQCLATICSCLKYYGTVVVGISHSRLQDKQALMELISEVPSSLQASIHIISFNISKPAFLPFHLLAWGQKYIQHRNCPPPDAQNNKNDLFEYQKYGYLFSNKIYYEQQHIGDDKYWDKYAICFVNVFQQHHRHAHNVHYRMNCDSNSNCNHIKYSSKNNYNKATSSFSISSPSYQFYHPDNILTDALNFKGKDDLNNSSYSHRYNNNNSWGSSIQIKYSRKNNSTYLHTWIKYIYYTESDQILRFDSSTTLIALSSALNDTTFFISRRREKDYNSVPERYMENLNNGRTCGQTGFSLVWK